MLDLVLSGGTVVDGSGAPGFPAEVGIAGDRIVAIGDGLQGRQKLDCAGQVIAPGFIDAHSHSDLRILAEPALPMKLRQGITLEVLGQDGISVAPVRPEERAASRQRLSGLLGDFGVDWDWSTVAEYLRRIEAARPAQDVAYLAPHGALRQWVMGGGDREAGPEELAALQQALRDALKEGACGLSTGLIYPPCCYADTAELVALGQVLAPGGQPFVVHLRSESDHLLDAAQEMVRVADESGCAVHISHLKIAGAENWKDAESLLAIFEEAQGRGRRITADQYPYAAGSTLLSAVLPPWTHDGGLEPALSRLRDPRARAAMREAMTASGPSDWDNFWRWTGPAGIVIADIPSGRHPEAVGRSLAEAAHRWGKDPVEAAFDLLLEERLGVAMISMSQDEPLVERLLTLPWACVGSDGLLGGRPHPRAFGSYPRILGRYVREKGILSLEEAARKMTSQAALAFGFQDCGWVRQGLRANLVVFDPQTVADRASFEDPLQFPVGIRDVLVGGEAVVRDGEITGARPGRVLRTTATTKAQGSPRRMRE
jgi:N-acyl-D-amino-acid deacylase